MITYLVTKRIVDQHRGAISVFSAGEGLGSTFTIRLPCYLGNDEVEDIELFDIDNGRSYLPERSNASIISQIYFTPDTTELLTEGMTNIEGASSSDAVLLMGILNSKECDDDDDAKETVEEKSDCLDVKTRSVLVVEDSHRTRKMVCKALEATKSFRCDQAEDGSMAVEMMRRQLAEACSYDLILMDYQMPNMYGPTAIS